MRRLLISIIVISLATGSLLAAACGNDDSLTIYSGRSRDLVQPLLEQFSEDTGISIRVRYGETAGLASTILEEGGNTPADVFFAQDAGALGALAREGRLAELPQGLLDRVPEPFRSPNAEWVGISGRARVVAYNTSAVDPAELPDSILDFTDPKWRGRIGWAPTNGSFQAFVTALREVEGEESARQWLEGIKANRPIDYPSNITALDAVANGEVDVAFVNHYYLHRMIEEEGEGYGARNHYMSGNDAGALINVAGAAILEGTDRRDDAQRFIEYLLSEDAQQYFTNETFEYPLADGVRAHEDLVALAELETPNIDLSNLDDLDGTLKLLRETGALP